MLWGLQGEGVVKELVDGFCALELEGDHLLQDAFGGGVARRVAADWRVDAQGGEGGRRGLHSRSFSTRKE